MDHQELQRRLDAKRASLAPSSTLTRVDFKAAFVDLLDGRIGCHVPQKTHSHIEEICDAHLVKYLRRETRRTNQRPIRTAFGHFRADVALTCPLTGRVLVIECDGADYHDYCSDAWRDAAMLGSGFVDDVLRIEGKDLVYRSHDVFLLLMRLFPTLFEDRARQVVEREASEVARAFRFADGAPIHLRYPPDPVVLQRDSRNTLEQQRDEPDDAPVDDPLDDVPRRRHAATDHHYEDFMFLQLRGTSRYAETDWELRLQALRARRDLSIRELVERERKTGLIG